MLRLVTRIYLLVFLILSVGALLPSITFMLDYEHNEEILKERLRGPMSVVAQRLEAADDFDAELSAVQRLFDFDVRVVSLRDEGVPVPLRLPWPRDYVHLEFGKGSDTLGYHKLSEERVLVFGPMRQLRLFGPLGIVLAIVVIFLGSWLLLRMVMRPLVKQSGVLEDAARAIGEGNLGIRISERAVPHSPELVRAFNTMTVRLRQLLVSHRQLLQDVSHELRTPLARVRFGIELLESEGQSPESRERVAGMLDESVQFLDRLLGELLEYTRMADQDRHAGKREQLEVEAVVDRSLGRLSLDAERGMQIEKQVHGTAPAFIEGDAREVGRALDNLLANAMRFAKQRIRVHVEQDGDWVELSVEDDGPGVPVDRRERVLQPFVQVERDGDHSGLGLAIVQRIVEGHGGNVVLDDSPELGGFWIRLRFPVQGN